MIRTIRMATPNEFYYLHTLLELYLVLELRNTPYIYIKSLLYGQLKKL